jgi:hypothetical protein
VIHYHSFNSWLVRVRIVTLFLGGLIAFVLPAHAETLQDLERQHRVTINSWLSTDNSATNTNINTGQADSGFASTISKTTSSTPKNAAKPVAIGEQVILYIEIATDRWLTAGTQIGLFEVDNAIVLRRKNLATNFTRRTNGETWTHQRWEITLYPQKSGQFVIPPIAVTLQISASTNNNVRGTLLTQPHRFNAALPSPYLTEDTPWVAGEDMTLTQSWSQKEEAPLVVGDAIERTITLAGKNISAMLFPILTPATTPQAQLYTAPETLTDSQNRGEYTAKRIDSYTYIVQHNGTITLPPIRLQWWDTQAQQLVTLKAPGAEWHIRHTPTSFLKAYWLPLLISLFSIVLMIWIVIKTVKKYRNQPLPSHFAFLLAIKRQQWPFANLLLYRKLYKHQHRYLLSKAEQSEQVMPATKENTNSQETRTGNQWHQAVMQWQTALYSTVPTPPSPQRGWRLWHGIKQPVRHLWSWRIPAVLPQLKKQLPRTTPMAKPAISSTPEFAAKTIKNAPRNTEQNNDNDVSN